MAYTGGKGKKRKLKRSAAACASCGARLQGVPKAGMIAVRRMPRSNRVPNRPYGGNLCVRCMREAFKSKVV
ncbi:MAG: 50S ribosomal protein L34e [Candidatus Aenigmatarchaeota archaeon]